jgi:hypothetical protein
MRATLLSVGREVQGSALVTAITSPSTVLEVDDAGDHPLISDKAFELSAASDPAQVEVEQRREKWYVTHLYDRTPELPALTALSESVDALEIAFAGISGGGGSNVGGGHWGDTYGSTSTGGGHWGDTYA